MKNKNLLVITFFLAIISNPVIVFAGNPSPFMRFLPSKGNVAIAARGGLLFKGDTFFGHGTFAYGLRSGIALNGHIGFGANPYDPYFGGDVRMTLFANQDVGFDAYFGGHAGGIGSGLDFGGLLNFNLGGLGILTGIDADYILEGNSNATPINLVLGLDIGLSKKTRFAVVTGLALTQTATSEITAGFNFYF